MRLKYVGVFLITFILLFLIGMVGTTITSHSIFGDFFERLVGGNSNAVQLSPALDNQEVIETKENNIAPLNNSALLSPSTSKSLGSGSPVPLSSRGFENIPKNKISYAKGEVIVKLKLGVTVETNRESVTFSVGSLNSLAKQYRFSKVTKLFPHNEDENLRNIFLIEFPKDEDVSKLVNDLNFDDNTVYSEPNFITETSRIELDGVAAKANSLSLQPNDPFIQQQWALPKTNSFQAWSLVGNPSNTPIIAVIDTGVQWDHLDLVNNIWTNIGEIPNNNIDDDNNGYIDDVHGWDFVETTSPCYPREDCSVEDNDPNDFHGHGTHVAGIAGAVTNNGIGIAGTCANFCKIMVVRAGFSNIYQGGGLETDDIAQSLVYSADNGANIISMSFGGLNSNLMQNAIDYAYSQGSVLVAAAGNDGTNDPLFSYPAAYPNVIAVGGSNQNDQRAWEYTNHGAWVDISAPGTLILSTVSPTSNFQIPPFTKTCVSSTECYQLLSGTSMSTPIVSGIIGLALAKSPTLSQNQILTLIHSSGDLMPPWNPLWPWGYTGAGRINAQKAIVQSSSVSLAMLDPALDHSVNGPQDLQIMGTATGQNFRSYRLDLTWGGDLPTNPTWTTIQPESNIAVTGGVLGTLRPASLGLYPETYTLRLLVTDVNGQEWEDRTVFVVDRKLVSGWGKTISDPTDSAPVYLDVDGDNKAELFFTALHTTNTINNVFYAIEDNSLPLSGWPISNFQPYFGFLSAPWLPSVAIDNIDEDSAFEIVYTTPYSSLAEYSVYETTGALQSGWPVIPAGTQPYETQLSPVIANIDGGNNKEVIVASQTYPRACGHQDNKVYVYDSQGQLLPGWPQIVNCIPAGISTGDVDANGDIEIVVSTYFGPQNNRELYVFNHDGTIMGGWPKIVSGGSQPSLADIDQNDGGRLEIVQIDSNGFMHVLNDDGTSLPGWPQSISAYGNSNSNPVIADVDTNGDMEIAVIGYGTLNVLNHDGTRITNQPIGLYGGQNIMVADLDADGYKELIMGFGGRPAWIRIYGYDGSYFDEKPLMYDSGYSYSVGDNNGNGLIDLFAIDSLGNTYLWDFTGNPTPQNLPWPMARHDAQNTGKY